MEIEEVEQSSVAPTETVDNATNDSTTPLVGETLGVGAQAKTPLGKFETVEALQKSYENLQADYTRKCQQLAKLQQGQARGAECEEPTVANQQNTISSGGMRDILPMESGRGSAETPAPVTPETRQRIVEEYLVAVARGSGAPKVITTPSDIVYGVKPVPPSISDTARIAENYFLNKGDLK